MAKELKVYCDKCGKEVQGQEYYTLPISRVKNGKMQRIHPTIWLCRDCFIKTGIFAPEEIKVSEKEMYKREN